MQPRRSWQLGDEYWALWLHGDHGRHFPVFEGHVTRVGERTVGLSTGTWRYVDEGLPFNSRAEADAFIEKHSVGEELPAVATCGNASSHERRPESKLEWTPRAEQRREATGSLVRRYIRHSRAV
jgi:hypothetical protein